MNRFFDMILEASLSDVDDLSATDAAAAVAAAAAGIRIPEEKIVVPPLIPQPTVPSTAKKLSSDEALGGESLQGKVSSSCLM